jgi:PAP2 superfamily.
VRGSLSYGPQINLARLPDTECMNTLNQHLYLLLNAGGNASALAIQTARLLAELPVGLGIVLVVIAWCRQKERRFFTLRLLLSVTLAMGGAVAARALFYNPRPFVLGLGRMLIEHEATSSFPSLHATFLFSLALPLLVMHGSRSIGLMVFVSGITVAWARIFVGVHYPFDMAGAVVTAAMATAVACAAVKRARPPRIVYLQR